MKVTVVGTGYVGLSLATLISRNFPVVAIDILQEKVDKINNKESPIVDTEIQKYLTEGNLNLKATTDINEGAGADYFIIATPTNYDPETHYFNTSSVESVIKNIIKISPESIIVVKSTVPIGFTKKICDKEGYQNVIFSPEFLREGKALYDNLHPSRIIVGTPYQTERLTYAAHQFISLLKGCSLEEEVPSMVIGSTEAESVKLFSNTFLAMRVAYFNELDTFAEENSLDSKQIICGVCMDPRIGNHYNNPSFGYGGYCLPKDTKQLLSNYENIPNSLIRAIVESNHIRKKFIADEVDHLIGRRKGTVGIYRLIMKSSSDNFRESSILDIMSDLSSRSLNILIYEPTITGKYKEWKIENNLNTFYNSCDIILANRMAEELIPYQNKVFCRDIFNRD